MALGQSKVSATINSDVRVQKLIERAEHAYVQFQSMNQIQIDTIVQQMALAGIERHMELAKLEFEETKRGVFEDKMLKNMFATETIFHQLKYIKTVGEIEVNRYEHYKLIAEPVGTIVAIISEHSPVYTALLKSLIAIKTRNPIIFVYEPSTEKCVVEAIQTVFDAAILSGAPPYSIQWISQAQLASAASLIGREEVAIVLVSGHASIAKEASLLGKYTISIHFGNTPCFIERTANLKQAVTDIIFSKNFDNSAGFSSEQALIVDLPILEHVRRMLTVLGCYFLSAVEIEAIKSTIYNKNGSFRKEFVGKSAFDIAKQAKILVSPDTNLLIAPLEEIGQHEPLSTAKPFPILALYKAIDTEEAIALANKLTLLDESKQFAIIHSTDEAKINLYSHKLQSNRVIINSPAIQCGSDHNERSPFSLSSLGYSSSHTHQTMIEDLLQLRQINNRSMNMQWLKIPPKLYFSPGATQYLVKMPNINRIFIVSDPQMESLGYIEKVFYFLQKRTNPVQIELFLGVDREPNIEIVMEGTHKMNAFQPDCIIALGGGSVIDAAKAMWLFYESPETSFDTIKMKFMSIRNRVYKYPQLGKRAKLVAIPTTSGTGSEVTSFATITASANGQSKYPLADYELTPDVAIIDSEYTMSLPAHIVADTGMDVLTHAIEAYVSIMANDYTDGLAIKAIQLVFENIEQSYSSADAAAREKMHNASTIAGMAFSNAFLGICHSLSHKFSAEFQLPHGRVNAILLPHIIRYNASKPTKFQSFSNYDHFQADVRYAEIARLVGLPAQSTSEGVQSLIYFVRQLNRSLGIPESFEQAGLSTTAFESKVEYLAERAFEDQYTNFNPRMPLVTELQQLYRQAFYGQFQE